MFETSTLLRTWRPALALLCTTALAPPAYAQTGAPVSGIIKDAQGQPLAGATVVFMPGNISTATNNKGEFLVNAPTGYYTATVTYLGYKPAK